MLKHVGHNGEFLLKQFLEGSAKVSGRNGQVKIFGTVFEAMELVRDKAWWDPLRRECSLGQFSPKNRS